MKAKLPTFEKIVQLREMYQVADADALPDRGGILRENYCIPSERVCLVMSSRSSLPVQASNFGVPSADKINSNGAICFSNSGGRNGGRVGSQVRTATATKGVGEDFWGENHEC